MVDMALLGACFRITVTDVTVDACRCGVESFVGFAMDRTGHRTCGLPLRAVWGIGIASSPVSARIVGAIPLLHGLRLVGRQSNTAN